MPKIILHFGQTSSFCRFELFCAIFLSKRPLIFNLKILHNHSYTAFRLHKILGKMKFWVAKISSGSGPPRGHLESGIKGGTKLCIKKGLNKRNYNILTWFEK